MRVAYFHSVRSRRSGLPGPVLKLLEGAVHKLFDTVGRPEDSLHTFGETYFRTFHNPKVRVEKARGEMLGVNAVLPTPGTDWNRFSVLSRRTA